MKIRRKLLGSVKETAEALLRVRAEHLDQVKSTQSETADILEDANTIILDSLKCPECKKRRG